MYALSEFPRLQYLQTGYKEVGDPPNPCLYEDIEMQYALSGQHMDALESEEWCAESGSTLSAYEDSTVWGEDGSTIFAYDHSYVYAKKGCTVVLCGRATVYAYEGCIIENHDAVSYKHIKVNGEN